MSPQIIQKQLVVSTVAVLCRFSGFISFNGFSFSVSSRSLDSCVSSWGLRWPMFDAKTCLVYFVSILKSDNTTWPRAFSTSVESAQCWEHLRARTNNSLLWFEQKCRRNQFLLRKKTAKRIGMKSLRTSLSRFSCNLNSDKSKNSISLK